MKFKFAALPLMVFAASAAAESYQSISNLDYENYEQPGADRDVLSLDTKYYFAPLESTGPNKEFEYIIKTTNIFSNYQFFDFEGGDADSLEVGGEYFAANGFVVGAGIADIDGTNVYRASLGYLFSPNFLLSVADVKAEGGDHVQFVNARYNHSLGGTDYIGFNFNTDDDFDSSTLSSKLFKELGGDTWFVAEASFTNNDDSENNWDLGAEYYFSKGTSVGAGYNKAEDIELNVSHFFNRNVAGKLAFVNGGDIDVDQFLLGVTVQL